MSEKTKFYLKNGHTYVRAQIETVFEIICDSVTSSYLDNNCVRFFHD